MRYGRIFSIILLACLVLVGCEDLPTASSGTQTTTITIGASGISPTTVQVVTGSRVRFTNNTNRAVDIRSNPHPTHTDCAEINVVGTLAVGQSRDTDAFSTAKTCGFHEETEPLDTLFQGTIIVIASTS